MSTTTDATASIMVGWRPEPQRDGGGDEDGAAGQREQRSSLMVRAALGRRLDIGKVAKRSWRPLVWSIATARPAFVPAITVATASMAGVRKSM